MAVGFRYHHYECFCSQIDLTKLTIVEGGLGNSLYKKCIHFSDAAPLKNQQKCYFFFKNTQKSRKTYPLLLTMCMFCFLWKLPLFCTPVHVSHVKWRPAVLRWISFIFSSISLQIKNSSLHFFGDCFRKRFSLTLESRYHQHKYL